MPKLTMDKDTALRLMRMPNEVDPKTLAENMRRIEQWGNQLRGIGKWQTPTYTAPFADYNAAWQGARYRQEGDLVRIEGLVKTTANVVAVNQTIFTLPKEMWPPLALTFLQVGSVTNEQYARVVVTAAGVVYLVGVANLAFPYTVAFLSLNMTFSTLPTL